MSLPFNLKPVSEAVARLTKDTAGCIKSFTQNQVKQMEKKISMLEQNRLVIPELLEFLRPYEIHVSLWDQGASVSVYLGKIEEQETRDKVRKIIGVLGPLRPYGKDAFSKDVISVKLQSRDFPGVLVNYTRTVKDSDRCKVVPYESTSYKVVCEV